MASGALTHFNSYIYEDSGAANHTAKLGRNTGPLGNYYAFEPSPVCLIVVLAAYRYTNPGGNSPSADNRGWVLGAAQQSWFEATLRNSSAKRK